MGSNPTLSAIAFLPSLPISRRLGIAPNSLGVFALLRVERPSAKALDLQAHRGIQQPPPSRSPALAEIEGDRCQESGATQRLRDRNQECVTASGALVEATVDEVFWARSFLRCPNGA